MNLRDLEGLRSACKLVESAARESDWYEPWGEELTQFLEYVHGADRAARESTEFHERLWNDNPVASAGQGSLNVSGAIADPEFRRWFAEKSVATLPQDRESRISFLRQFHEDCLDRLKTYTTYAPRVKLFRALAALFPADFTTVAHMGRLRQLSSAMGLPTGGSSIAWHSNILGRLDEALGRVDSNAAALSARMRIPWLLYTKLAVESDEEVTETMDSRPGNEALKPLRAARRRRGMTGISGGFNAILNILEFAKDGATPEDLKDHIRTQSPQLKESSINTSMNVLISEYNVLHRDGDLYRLSPRGQALLDSGDPNEVVDWVLTRILGADHVLVWLRDEGTADRGTLVKRLQDVNPGWTATFGPTVLLQCLRQLELIDVVNGLHELTETGRTWAARIDWTPERLPKEKGDVVELGDEGLVNGSVPGAALTVESLPSIETIVDSVGKHGYYFPDWVIVKLHTGLWAHERRHFAVLTGLSGTGKTQLALRYGQAISRDRDDSSARVRIVPVQPGWHDPTPLLGYVNPLRSATYVRTDFLEFLIQAASDAEHAYTVILDEMNLSRPEQYLAPLLSAMETGAPIVLHREGDMLDGVPASVSYPRNLVLMGTVNMDETTHGLSDKVLDRAFTIEFWDIDLDDYPRWGSRGMPAEAESFAKDVLAHLMDNLRPARLHFGWRTIDDVLDYLAATAAMTKLPIADAMDAVIYAKVLPKLRGDDSPRFREALKNCAEILRQHSLAMSHNRVEELLEDLMSTGSARFWR